MNQIIENITYNSNYLFIYIFLYHLFLYFVVGHIFVYFCRVLSKRGWLEKIINQTITREQYLFEKKNSLISILIISIVGFIQFYLIRISWIELDENTWSSVLIGLLILNLWNEVHFFLIHRMMHIPFFMKHVHKIHHKSSVPTVFSGYSFHWFEALLLGTVTLSITPFVKLSLIAIFLYPLNSILLNFSGHCNYKFKNNWINKNVTSYGINHNNHHSKYAKNFSFVTSVLDKIFSRGKS